MVDREEVKKICALILEKLEETNNPKEASKIFYGCNLEHQIAIVFEIQMNALLELKNHPLLKF